MCWREEMTSRKEETIKSYKKENVKTNDPQRSFSNLLLIFTPSSRFPLNFWFSSNNKGKLPKKAFRALLHFSHSNSQNMAFGANTKRNECHPFSAKAVMKRRNQLALVTFLPLQPGWSWPHVDFLPEKCGKVWLKLLQPGGDKERLVTWPVSGHLI